MPGCEHLGEDAITSALTSRGYRRIIRKKQPYNDPRVRAKRMDYCLWGLSTRPQPRDWLDIEPIAFSDKVWAMNSATGTKFMTVHETEDPSSFDLMRQRPYGWMCWGMICGPYKGPLFVWPKHFGNIDAKKYITFVLPKALQFIREMRHVYGRDDIRFQHDGASAHRARETTAWLREHGINPLRWPPYSPDLNPIENVWSWMKAWLDDHYDLGLLTLDDLKHAINEAWDAVPRELLINVALSIPTRLKECLDNDGSPTRY